MYIHLADFTAQQGVRDTTDIMEKYRKGALGALPDPELINSSIRVLKETRREMVADDRVDYRLSFQRHKIMYYLRRG